MKILAVKGLREFDSNNNKIHTLLYEHQVATVVNSSNSSYSMNWSGLKHSSFVYFDLLMDSENWVVLKLSSLRMFSSVLVINSMESAEECALVTYSFLYSKVNNKFKIYDSLSFLSV